MALARMHLKDFSQGLTTPMALHREANASTADITPTLHFSTSPFDKNDAKVPHIMVGPANSKHIYLQNQLNLMAAPGKHVYKYMQILCQLVADLLQLACILGGTADLLA